MTFKDRYLLTKILTPALHTWLHSQLDTVNGLHLQINSSDYQLLRGTIPKLVLNSEFAIYQGLRFDHIAVTAEQIKINIMELLKGQSLQLLNPVPLSGTIKISQSNLSASLNSSLLQSGLKDLLSRLLNSQQVPPIQWNKIDIDHQQLILEGKQLTASQNPIFIQAELSLKSPQELLIKPKYLEGLTIDQHNYTTMAFDFGSSVYLHQLTIHEQAVLLQGRLTIFPETTDSSQDKTTL